MPTHRRDAALAAGALAVFVAVLASEGAAGALVRPAAVGGGVGGALLVLGRSPLARVA